MHILKLSCYFIKMQRNYEKSLNQKKFFFFQVTLITLNTLIRRIGNCEIFLLLSGYSLVRGNGLFEYKSKIWMCACIFECHYLWNTYDINQSKRIKQSRQQSQRAEND